MKEEVPGYNCLTEVKETLPIEYYLDQDHYKRELELIWYKNWVYVCRADALAEQLAYRTIEIGSQNIIVLRDDNDNLQSYHNTCRHRGSILVTEAEGVLRSKSIVCPYHNWSYSLDGDLQHTSSKHCPSDFDQSDHSLYEVAVIEWNGCVFVNLAGENAKPIEECIQNGSADLNNWPMADLKVGHSFRKTMDCNWKIFWENFNECLHCPRVHKDLSKLVPIYGRALLDPHDDPDWKVKIKSSDPKFSGGLRKGAQTWTTNGLPIGKVFPNLSEQEIKEAHNYTVIYPTVFIVAHVDYIRVVRLMPLGPEKTEMHVEWLFTEETLIDDNIDIGPAIDFVKTVLLEDAYVSELNQKGIRSIRHKKGTLMPEEYDVYAFHTWVRQQLGFSSVSVD
jgi:Rieske 2Fe-2S family protein